MKKVLSNVEICQNAKTLCANNSTAISLGRDSQHEMVAIPGGASFANWTTPSTEPDIVFLSSGSAMPAAEPAATVPQAATVPPAATSSRGGPSARQGHGGRTQPQVTETEPDRDALEARYNAIMSMPDSRRTVEERALVRQVYIVKLLERRLADSLDDGEELPVSALM